MMLVTALKGVTAGVYGAPKHVTFESPPRPPPAGPKDPQTFGFGSPWASDKDYFFVLRRLFFFLLFVEEKNGLYYRQIGLHKASE